MSFSLIWESQDQITASGDDSIETIQAGTDAQVLQMTEDAQPVLDGANEIDKVVQGVGQLGQVKQFVDAQVAQGGMTEQTAQLAQIHVESICNALRYPNKTSPIPSAENFGSAGSKIQSTRLASEGIADRAKTMFEAVKKFLKKVVGMAADAWSGLWNNAMLLEKRLDMMEKKVKDLKGTPGSDQIDCKAALKLLGQKTFTAANIKATIEPVSKALGILENVADTIGSANTNLKKMLSTSTSLSETSSPFSAAFMKTEMAKLGANSFETKDGADVAKSDIMPGGRVTVFTVTETEGVGSLSISVERDEMKDVTEKMAPLPKDEMLAVLKAAREVFTALKSKKDNASKLKKVGSDIESSIDSIMSASKNKPTDAKDDALKAHEEKLSKALDSIKSMYITQVNYATKMVTTGTIMTGEIVRGVLDIVGKSASGFKEAAKA